MTRPLSEEFDPDQPVVEAVVRGDRFAFEDLRRRHLDWVRAVAFGVLCDADRLDDVTQQVWTTFWQGVGGLRDPSRWRPWLYRLAKNAAVDVGRDRSRTKQAADRALMNPTLSLTQASPADELATAEQRAVVLEAVKALSPLYREPFVLRHMQGWNYRQISDVMGIPVDTVETRLVRARRILRDSLRDKV